MAKRTPRLQFSEEELADPAIRKSAEKAEKAVEKLENSESKIPKKAVIKRAVTPDGRGTARLSFEEKEPPSRLVYSVDDAPMNSLRETVRREIRESDDDNAGTEAADTLTEKAEEGFRMMETAHRSHQEKPYREAHRAEVSADRANIRALETEYEKTEGYAANSERL